MEIARTILIVSLGAVAMLAAPPVASAVVLNVNTTADGSDFNTADNFCDSDFGTAGEQCTLRAAIQQAVTPIGQDTISVPAGTYTLNSPNALMVTSPVVVDGAGAATTVIRQQLNGRVLQVSLGASLDLRDVTVRDGVVADDGGGVYASGPLVVRRSVIRSNQAIGSRGGGIYADPNGALTVEDSVIGGSGPGAGNSAGKSGSGVYTGVGLVMRDSAVLGNVFDGTNASTAGAGVQSFGPTTVTRSTIAGNGDGDTDSGGGISHLGASLTLADSTVSGNHAEFVGSAIVVRETAAATVRNVTVSGNTPSGGSPTVGPVFVQDGTLSAQHVTIAGNSAPTGNALTLFTGSAAETAVANVRASILDGGAGTACGTSGGGSETLTSAGSNVMADASCGFAAPGDVVAGPELGPLADNGGPTRTRALAGSSPAVNRVSPGCPPPAADQRGVPRPQGGRCDSGAYELARCGGAIVNRVGTAGGDSLTGTAGPDAFLLLAGSDAATGGGGKDVACGGAGRDRLRGGGGGDRLLGEAGADQLFGGAGMDSLYGAAGADRLFGGAARDRLIGGKGRDRLRGGGGRDRLIGGPGRDRQVQ